LSFSQFKEEGAQATSALKLQWGKCFSFLCWRTRKRPLLAAVLTSQQVYNMNSMGWFLSFQKLVSQPWLLWD